MNVPCSSQLAWVLMTRAGLGGLPGSARIKRLKGVAAADDLLNRKKWKARIEFANAIFEHVEVFYNPRRRYSSLQYAPPYDYDLAGTLRAFANTGN